MWGPLGTYGLQPQLEVTVGGVDLGQGTRCCSPAPSLLDTCSHDMPEVR